MYAFPSSFYDVWWETPTFSFLNCTFLITFYFISIRQAPCGYPWELHVVCIKSSFNFMYKSFLNVKKIVTSQFRLWKEKEIFFHISIFRLQKNISMEKIVSHHEKKSLYNHFSVKSVWKWEKLKIRLYKWSFLSTETYKTYLENWCFLLTSTFFYFIRIWFCPIYTIFSLSIHAFHQVNYILKLINLLFPTNKLFFF